MHPQFKAGDLVSHKSTLSKGVGIVVGVYDFQGQTRCAVLFNDGSESVFLWLELVAADGGVDQV